MVDIFDKEKRSRIMSKIGPKNTKPEIIIRKLIYSMGYRYRLYQENLPGHPDLVFPKYKKVIFINGCYWHGHTCKRASLPSTNRTFWQTKITKNIERDKNNYGLLEQLGWRYLVIWQCEIKKGLYDVLSQNIENFLGPILHK